MPVTLKEYEESRLENLLRTLEDVDPEFGSRLIESVNAVMRETRNEARRNTLKDVESQLRQRGQDGLAQLFEQQRKTV